MLTERRAPSELANGSVHSPWTKVYGALLVISAALALAFVVTLFAGPRHWTMPILSAGFFSFALASRGYAQPRKMSFMIWIVTAVVIGMTFPSWFIGVGDFKFTRLFIPILQLIMFGMGTTLSVEDFARVFRMPKAVLV